MPLKSELVFKYVLVIILCKNGLDFPSICHVKPEISAGVIIIYNKHSDIVYVMKVLVANKGVSVEHQKKGQSVKVFTNISSSMFMTWEEFQKLPWILSRIQGLCITQDVLVCENIDTPIRQITIYFKAWLIKQIIFCI